MSVPLLYRIKVVFTFNQSTEFLADAYQELPDRLEVATRDVKTVVLTGNVLYYTVHPYTEDKQG